MQCVRIKGHESRDARIEAANCERAEPAARCGFAPAPSLDYRCRGGLALAIKLNKGHVHGFQTSLLGEL